MSKTVEIIFWTAVAFSPCVVGFGTFLLQRFNVWHRCRQMLMLNSRIRSAYARRHVEFGWARPAVVLPMLVDELLAGRRTAKGTVVVVDNGKSKLESAIRAWLATGLTVQYVVVARSAETKASETDDVAALLADKPDGLELYDLTRVPNTDGQPLEPFFMMQRMHQVLFEIEGGCDADAADGLSRALWLERSHYPNDDYVENAEWVPPCRMRSPKTRYDVATWRHEYEIRSALTTKAIEQASPFKEQAAPAAKAAAREEADAMA